MSINRRALLCSLLALPTPVFATAAPEQTLRGDAGRRSRVYGTSVSSRNLASDSSFSRIVAQEADVLVAEFETKRAFVERNPDSFDFSGTDAILQFADANDQKMRGHTLAWHQANPAWLVTQLLETKNEKLLTDYIAKVMSRYRGKIRAWDVVNEAIEPMDGHPDGLRSSSPWFQALGPEYIETAFYAARAADPRALLFYNETNLESETTADQKRRDATLELLERLVAKGVPVGAVGIQSHLKLYKQKYSQNTISRFIDDIGAMGLPVLLTEFDVADIKGPADVKQRDSDVAAITRMYLDVAFSKKHVLGCVTWGITDKYSWLSSTPAYKWPDGQFSRGLPYDSDYQKKPMWTAIADAFQKSVI